MQMEISTAVCMNERYVFVCFTISKCHIVYDRGAGEEMHRGL